MLVEGICISQGSPDTANSFCCLSVCVCIYTCLYIYIHIYIYMYICIKKFILRGWLTWLWRLRQPETCSQNVENPGEPTCSYSLRTKAWEQELKVWVQAWKPGVSAPMNGWNFSLIQSQEKTDVSALQSGISCYSWKNWPSCLAQAFSLLDRATLTGETNAQHSDLNVNVTQQHVHKHTQNNI